MKKSKLQVSLGILRVFSCFLLMAVLTDCRGPEGPMGVPGYDGLDGADGQDGADGTAFSYSVIYDVDPADWIGDVDGYNAELNVAEITDDIYYNGAVLVYRLIEIDPKSFNMLPYTYVDNALSIYMDFDAYVGSINLIYKEVFDGANDTPAPADVMSFKIVIVEGIPLATLKTMVDVKDYSAVTKRFNLQEQNVNVMK
jgi:hypothetical protein